MEIMNAKTGYRKWNHFISMIVILAMTLGSSASVGVLAKTDAAPQAATTNTLHLSVISAADSAAYGVVKGQAITDFKYIINIDNTGTTEQRSPALGTGCSPDDAGYPGTCNWVSIAGRANNSPIYTQGDSSDFGPGIDFPSTCTVTAPCRYLVSVLADGFKLDGEHFTVPVQNNGNVTVRMQPWDLPDATIQAAVFEDMAPTNSAPDVPAERGIAGFKAHIKDYIDEVTTDVYGGPICGNGQCLSKCYVVDGGMDLGIVSPIDSAGHCPFRSELAANETTVDTNVVIPEDAVIMGKVVIPNVGPNRYALSVAPPDATDWIQTTTLEGNHDWDAWVMEGATGLDTEFVVAGEPFPATFFGYVLPTNTMGTGSSGIVQGIAQAVSAYIPPTGGIVGETGLLGAKPKDKNPIHTFYVSLSDINNNDQTVYVGEFNCNEGAGCPAPSFSIPNVPDGDYFFGIWDEPQDFIFNEQNVSVRNGEPVDLGSISMLGWWTTLEGHVFYDDNENGKMDPGEAGIPNFTIVNRTRENSIMDRGSPVVTTDASGYYWMESFYPMTQWLVTEAYADGFHTTGITYQADNQRDETTVLGAGVDVNFHPVIGLGARLDWGVKEYAPGTNGGIVGTISYDTTRNELNPQYAAIEDWQPSISDLTVNLYSPEPCTTFDTNGNPIKCDPMGLYALNDDGSYKFGKLLNTYLSETWEQPSGCIARGVNGDPLAHGTDEQVLPLNPNAPCLEAPMMGVQFGPMATDQYILDGNGDPVLDGNGNPIRNPDAAFGASVDGNYGFGDGCFNGTLDATDPANPICVDGSFDPLPSNMDYLVQVEVPNDALGRPMYQVTREEDINVANGDSFVPQVPPPACAGALHTVDLAGAQTDGYIAVSGTGYEGNGIALGVTVPASKPVDNAPFLDMGGTVYEGQAKPLCDVKLVHLGDGKSIAPGFNFFTDVPLPGRFWGLLVDDLNFSSNPRSTSYGEKLGIPFAPVGIYDYTNRLITTVESDYNGLWDVLLPSTNRIACPTPSGVCANLYRTVGNDPGTPGHWNPNYNPQYRTIAAEFETFPGLTIPADLAPTPVAVAVQIPSTQTIQPISCTLNDMTDATPATNPEFFSVNKPYARVSDSSTNRTITITGLGFGGTMGNVTLLRNTSFGDTVDLPITPNSWSDTSISFTLPGSLPSAFHTGPHQLQIRTSVGKSTVNALTFHVLNNANAGSGTGIYNPTIFEVGIGKAYDPNAAVYNPLSLSYDPTRIGPIQDALNDAANVTRALVVVYPGQVDNTNPRYNGRGAYYENIIMHSPLKLQGVGPGGVYPAGMGLAPVQGSIIDGIAFGGDTDMAEAFRVLAEGLPRAGNQDVYEGQVIYVLPGNTSQFASSHTNKFDASIDGFNIRGGDQMGFPGNLNAIFGGFPGPAAAANVQTQGGAVFANAYASYLGITNNIVENNGGSYGTIRIGTPNIDPNDNHNDHLRIANNRILANGGTNLAGAVGLFGGSDNYEVAGNDICGNFSSEYGGGISHFGLSPNGSIHDNRVYFNHSYDEGAGILIAGELATDPGANYGQPGGPQGSGAVSVFNNLIQANMSEDDGGGLRFLMAGDFPFNVYNNMIVNNISTHEGGGVALDDAPNVRFYNNTVMNNKTTATAITSDGNPAPAGLSTGANSDQLQPTLPGGSPLFSNPLLFNNIFFNNWAGKKGINTVTGIGAAGDLTPVNSWDLGSLDLSINLEPTNSIVEQTAYPFTSSPSNIAVDPAVIATHDIPLSFTSWRTNINFTGAIMVTADLPPSLMGNYHLSGDTSPAYNTGAASEAVPSYQQPPTSLSAPSFDIDNQGRPGFGAFDIGADEIPTPTADLSITKSDGATSVLQGSQVHYSITVSNSGPQAANNATVTDTVPEVLTGVNWTCVTNVGGGSCDVVNGNGSNSISTTVDLPAGGSVLITVNGTLSATTTGSLINTASVAAPAGITDPVSSNNSATDINTIVPSMHIGNLTVTTTNTSATNWSATVTITAHDGSHNLLGGVTVSGNWTGGGSGGTSCTTSSTAGPAFGTCPVTRTGLSKSSNTSATFTVNSLSRTGYGYLSSANDASSITASRLTISVTSLTSSASGTSPNPWSTTVTITVRDSANNLVGGAAVSGNWSSPAGSGSGSNGSGGTGGCTTSSIAGPTFGTCTVTRTLIASTRTRVAYTISGVTKASGSPAVFYVAGPITSITVNRPY